jgi:hypothetical protein
MILRIESTPVTVNPGAMSTQAATGMEQSLQMQRQEGLTALRNHPASGRLVINISTDIGKWGNTPADIVLRAGDTLFIPKGTSAQVCDFAATTRPQMIS